MALDVGMKAPEFTANIAEEKQISLADFIGKWVVLYFYTKDNTSGCTLEACDFRDNMNSLTTMGAVVIGVSPDSVKSHKNFTEKYNLNFFLASDIDKTICNLYDVMGEKSMYGKKYFGIVRTTFIINPEGYIADTFYKVQVKGHVQEIMDILSQKIYSKN